MENEEKDFRLRSLKDLSSFVGQNKLLVGAMLSAYICSEGIRSYQRFSSSDSKCDVETDQILNETQQRLEEINQVLETMKDKYYPCSKKTGRELWTAQMWVRDHLTELFVDLVPNCKTYVDCPLEDDTTQFATDFIDNLFTAQFFCPPFDRVDEEGAIALASTPRDHDPSLEVQVFFYPWNFDTEQDSRCILVHDVVHELIHATTGFEHDDSRKKDELDWAYDMGYTAYDLCTEDPPEKWKARMKMAQEQ